MRNIITFLFRHALDGIPSSWEDPQEKNAAHSQHTPVFISPGYRPDPKCMTINKRKILRMRNILTFLFRHA
jgi:hypothetical protein